MRIFVLALLLVANAAGAVTNYVIYCSSTNAAAGAGTLANPYKALASVSWATVGAQIAAGNPVHISLQRGSRFTEILTVATNGTPGAMIFVDSYGSGAKPIIDGGSTRANAVLATSMSNICVMDLSVTNTTSYSLKWATCQNVQMWRVDSQGCWCALYDNGSTNLTAASCYFQSTLAPQVVKIDGASSGYTFYFCFIGNSPVVTYGVDSSAGTGGAFVNCDFVGINNTHIHNSSSSATIGVTNCVFSGVACGLTSGSYVADSTAGTCIFDHCMVMSNGRNMANRLSGVTEYNIVWGEPKYTHARYPAFLMMGEDDAATWDDWLLLAAQMLARGWHSYECYSSKSSVEGFITDTVSNQMNTAVSQGHEVICHTRYHSTLTNETAFIIQYVGTAATATMSFSNSLLTTLTNGVQGLSLNVSNYVDTAALIAAIDALSDYTCVAQTIINHRVPPRLITNLVAIDIKSATYTTWYDTVALFNEEIVLSESDLETVLSPLSETMTEMVYPDGDRNTTIEQAVKDAGYLGSRSTAPPGGGNFLINSNNVYDLNAGVGLFACISSSLLLAGNTTDASAAGANFTASGITWATANPFRLTTYGSFNGTSSYASRADLASFDWSFGDLLILCQTWPTSLAATNTYYFQGDDASNYFTIYVESNGSVGVVGLSNGIAMINLHTAAGVVTNGGWQQISVQELRNDWWIRVGNGDGLNGVVRATTNTPLRLKNLSGTLYLGCGFDFGSSTRTNFYAGKLCDVQFVNQIYYKMQSFLDFCTEAGAIGSIYSHGESVAPRDMYRVMLDAAQDYSGGVTVLPMRGIIQYTRTNGTVQADGFTYVRNTPLVPAANYLPLSTSPLVASGLALVPAGMTNVTDLGGVSITDSGGVLLNQTVSVGAYEQATQTSAVTTSSITGNSVISGNVIIR